MLYTASHITDILNYPLYIKELHNRFRQESLFDFEFYRLALLISLIIAA